MFTEIPNHADQALKRLVTQYKRKPLLAGLIRAMVDPYQDLETALLSLNTGRSIASAVGVQLDRLGVILGIARTAGESDAAYRIVLIAQSHLNISQGEPERVIEAFKVVAMPTLLLLDELYPGSLAIESDAPLGDQDTVNHQIRLLQRVAPAGVRIDFISNFPMVNAFAFDGDLAGAGFSDDTATQGGAFGDHMEFVLPFAFDGDDPNTDGFGYGTEDPLVGGGFVDA